MAYPNLVTEFRTTIDEIVHQLPEQGTAYARGLAFVSADAEHPRPLQFGIEAPQEHVWGVSPERRLKTAGFTGRLAIISSAERTELIRSWELEGPGIFTVVRTTRPLSEGEAEGIFEWMNAPRIFTEYLPVVGRLSNRETETVMSKMGHLQVVDQQRKANVSAILRSRNFPPATDRLA